MLEIPSFLAGLLAFFFVFVLMGVMFFVLREDRDKTIPELATVGPTDITKIDSPSAVPDAPFIAIVTLVMIELVVDALIVVSVVQGAGPFAIGTMLAVGTFIAAAILAVYRSNFLTEAFLRKPRLETIATRLYEKNEGEKN